MVTKRPGSSSSEDDFLNQKHNKNRSVIVDRPHAVEALLLSTEEDDDEVDDLTTKNQFQ
jgi:hypothetical protein